MPESKKKTVAKHTQKEESVSLKEPEAEQVSEKKSEEVPPASEKETTQVETESSSVASATEGAAKPVIEPRDVEWPSSQSAGFEAQSAPSKVSPASVAQAPSGQSPKEGVEGSEGTSEERPIVVTEEKKKPWVFIVLIVLGLALGVALFFLRDTLGKVASQVATQTGMKKEKVVATPSSKQKPTTMPSPTPEKIDLSKYSITVLNGSGIKGEAAKVKDMLEEEGFSVVSVGNADASDYEKTILKAKEGVEAGFLDKLKSALSKSYVLASTQTLEKNDEDEIVVIIGSEKAE